MKLSLKLTIDHGNFGFETYTLRGMSPDSAPCVLQARYEGDPIYHSCPEQPSMSSEARWQIIGPTAETLVAKLMALPIPPPAERAFGLDGQTTTLSLQRGTQRVRRSWWGDLPPGWQDVGGLLELFYASRPASIL